MPLTDDPLPEIMRVGIGASAGGLAALKELFSHVPGDSGLAFVVVVHLAPDHPSLLADLLQPCAAMPVLQVTEDMVVEADHVYVIPPGSNLSTIDSRLRLSGIEAPRRERAPIDHFFATLATIHGERCVGVVLSGTGSDGSLGIGKIKERGGLTIAQDPTEAAFDGMPQNAIATGLIDLILPVRDMPRHIMRFARTRPRIEIAEGSDQAPSRDRQLLQQIFAEVRARTGHDFSTYKRSTVLRRVRRRMQLHHKEVLGDYLQLLRENPNEAHLLAEEFLITVTQFFRDAQTFAYLEKDVIPRLLDGKAASDSIRVWSVGCATGEEAYSVAMLLLEQAGRAKAAPKLEIFASDLHEDSLQRAREGRYPDTVEADVSAQRLRRFFTKEDSSYRIRKEVREILVFAAHNLLRDPPFSRLDLIVCRNLLIYLQRAAQNDVIELFHYALKPDGLLLLGPSETIERTALFEPQSKHHCLYRRRNVPAPEPRLPVFPHLPRRWNWAQGVHLHSEPMVSYGALHQKMVERYALPSVLVDQDLRIVHASEHAGRYLQVPGGEPSASVLKLAREELRIELRAALQTASERGESVRSRPIPLELEGTPKEVVLHVRPSRDPELGGLNLVIFDERQTSAAASALGAGPQHGAQARSELGETRERLRTLLEQYETSQEEMRAANEELQSANEELRSTMEELETSKEELQSMNEELQTVNQENRHKVEELSQLTGDLQNLIAATDIATLFLDRELRILRVTPRATQLFNIRASDRGRPLSELRHRLGYDQLEADTRGVLAQRVPVAREIQSESGEWYLTRVLPYRSPADQIQGVVITLVEITQLKSAALALRDSEEKFRALVSASAQIVWTTDAQGQVVEDSPSWRAFTGQSVDQWRGTGWSDAVHPDDRDFARESWLHCVATATPMDIEFRLHHVSGGWRWTHVRAVPLRADDGTVRGWVGMNADITERKVAEEGLRQADRRKDEFLAMLGHELRNPLAPMRSAMEIFKELLPADPTLERVRAMNERQVLHLTRLVDDLLDVSRITSDRMELRLQRLDLRAVVASAIADMQSTIAARRHGLSVQQAPEALEIEGDEVRLVQIVTNLLTNAVKYTPEGGQLCITTKRDSNAAALCVADNGSGLAPEMLTQVFDLFTQGPRDHARPSVGLGIGLTLVKRLTELHGGTIQARSEGPGRGSEFSVRLPLAAGGEGVPAASEVADHDREARAKRVMVVDDNHDVADSLAVALGTTAGHAVRQAYDGRSALEMAAIFAPDVVVLDIGLPDMDGYAVARELRKQASTASARLIALTGYGDDVAVARSAEAGFDHHLVKPVSLAQLQAVIEGKERAAK